MKIDQSLNLVATVERESVPLYVYVTPFPYEVIEQYYGILGQTFSRFYQDIGQIGSPRVAGMMLREAAKAAMPDGYTGNTVFDEIYRLSRVVTLVNGEWKSYPLAQALEKEIISKEEWRDVEGEVCFFIVSCAMQKRNLIPALVGKVLSMYGAQLTSSSVTAFLASLPTSKTEDAPETTGEVANQESSEPVTDPAFIPS